MAAVAENRKNADPLVSVVVVAYQSKPTLARCLEALRAQTFTDFEILLVDNASADGAPQAAAAADPAIRLIEPKANLGFAAGNNLAARAARGRWLALLNPDAYAQPDWLERWMAATRAWPTVRSFASLQIAADAPNLLDGAGDVMSASGFPFRGGHGSPRPAATPTGEVFSACGAAHLIERDLFLELDGFDESFFCYCEDVDLGYRLRLIGEPTLLTPEAVVAHVGSASTSVRSDFALFHGTRNRVWLFVKNTPWPLLWLTAPMHALATLVLMARHATRGEAREPLRGLAAALRGLGPAWRARRAIQRGRKASWLAIAGAMTWNPLDLFGMRVVIKPAKARRSSAA
ncbi:MAG: glycosyltransferase family 2 protein [Caulobacter sp.]